MATSWLRISNTTLDIVIYENTSLLFFQPEINLNSSLPALFWSLFLLTSTHFMFVEMSTLRVSSFLVFAVNVLRRPHLYLLWHVATWCLWKSQFSWLEYEALHVPLVSFIWELSSPCIHIYIYAQTDILTWTKTYMYSYTYYFQWDTYWSLKELKI